MAFSGAQLTGQVAALQVFATKHDLAQGRGLPQPGEVRTQHGTSRLRPTGYALLATGCWLFGCVAP